jgi:hypothetical protein
LLGHMEPEVLIDSAKGLENFWCTQEDRTWPCIWWIQGMWGYMDGLALLNLTSNA